MNAPLPEPIASLGVIGVLLIVFPLCVWVLQGACYFCRLEVPSFGKACLVTLATGIACFAMEQIFDIEPTGQQYVIMLLGSIVLSILVQSLMLNISLFDSLRVQITGMLLCLTGCVLLVMLALGGSALMRTQVTKPSAAPNEGPPAASLAGGYAAPEPREERVFLPDPASPASELSQPREMQERPVLFSH